jgi:hypothetical protein
MKTYYGSLKDMVAILEGKSISSILKTYVGIQKNNMDVRNPDTRRIGHC